MQSTGVRDRVSGISLRQAALITGITYVLNPVTYAEGYAMPHLVRMDAAQTMANISSHPHMFAAAVLSYCFSLVGDIIFAWSLYILLAPVNRALSLLGSFLQLAYATVSLSAVSNLGLLYRLWIIPDYSRYAIPSELPFQGMQLLEAFRSGWGLGLILFGMHLVVTGWLMARSTYLPKWLGWLIFVDGWAWIIDNLSVYLFPNASLGFLNAFFAAEVIFMVWLLGWGWRLKEPDVA